MRALCGDGYGRHGPRPEAPRYAAERLLRDGYDYGPRDDSSVLGKHTLATSELRRVSWSAVPARAPSGRPPGALSGARARWFRPAGAYWSPELYEHYFARTRLGARLRGGDDRIVHAALDRLLAPQDEVLEVGAGTGHYTVALARRCARVTALDAAPEMTGYLRRRVAREGLGNVEAGVARLPDAVAASGPFDGVVCLGVLGYVGDLDAGLRALAERLSPGGWMLVSLPPLTLEGRVHALVELLGRRKVTLRSPAAAVAAAHRAGLSVEAQARAGLTAGGITVLLEARRRGAGRAELGRTP